MPGHVFTIRETRSADVDVFMDFISRLDPDAPNLVPLRRALDEGGKLSLETDLSLALVAADERGRPVGALFGGVPKWLVDHPGCAPGDIVRIILRVGYISAVFVTPEYRRIGVGRALIDRAENDFREAGRKLVTLMHGPELTPYYSALGYDTSLHFATHVANDVLLCADSDDGTHMAAKALDPCVDRKLVAGVRVPVLTGVLYEEALPAGAWFDGQSLRFDDMVCAVLAPDGPRPLHPPRLARSEQGMSTP